MENIRSAVPAERTAHDSELLPDSPMRDRVERTEDLAESLSRALDLLEEKVQPFVSPANHVGCGSDQSDRCSTTMARLERANYRLSHLEGRVLSLAKRAQP